MKHWRVTTVDVMRHGKPEGGDIFRGSVDVPLSDAGWSQMHDGARRLQSPEVHEWDTIVTSPLQRCSAFAHDIANNDSAVVVEKDFREISFGEWDGQTFKAVEETWGDQFNNYWRNPIDNTPPDGEPLREFAQRVNDAFWALTGANEGKNILLVTHGGVIRAVLSLVLASPMNSFMRYDVPYASVSRIQVYHTEDGLLPQLEFHNR